MLLREISASFTSRSPGIATLGPSGTPSRQSNREYWSHRVLMDPQRRERFAETILLRMARVVGPVSRGDHAGHAVPSRFADGLQHGSWSVFRSTRRSCGQSFRPERNDQEAGRAGFEPAKPWTPNRQSSVSSCWNLKRNDEVVARGLRALPLSYSHHVGKGDWWDSNPRPRGVQPCTPNRQSFRVLCK